MSDPATKISRSAAKDRRQGVSTLREHEQHTKKNTARSCKGKRGVEHEYIVGDAAPFLGRWRWRTDYCKHCGKKKFVSLGCV